MLTILSLVYLYLPMIIFLSGWTKAAVCLMALLSIGYAFTGVYGYARRKDMERQLIKPDPFVTVFAMLLFLWVGYYAGWGRWVDQAPDWLKHNAVLCDLVYKSWPVYYHNGNERSMLVYYIAQYMVPAAVGKLFHSVRAAEIMMYIWNETGLFLAFIHMINLIKARHHVMQFITAVAAAFFSIPLWISEYVLRMVSDFNRVGEGFWFFWDVDILVQYSSNFTLLRWVVPQVIPCWIILALFLESRDAIEFHAMMVLPGLLFGSLSFLGIIPIVIAGDTETLCKGRDIKKALRKIFSIENLLVMLTLGVIFGLYFYGNVFSAKPAPMSFSLIPYGPKIIVYFVFVFVNIFVYAVILWKDNRRDTVFLTTVVLLMLLPLFKMGVNNDLVMRMSIPGLFILMILVLRFINSHLTATDISTDNSLFMRISRLIVIIFFITGMFYPFRELSDVIKESEKGVNGHGNEWTTLEVYANRYLVENDDVKFNYYAYDAQSNLFCRYIARKKP
ncbi:MAG: hypothetical protein K5886_05380 [Lachnospiraceae bacterium]|nr:hypothetical protein [Lachnospiraceae bacterium]